MPDHIKKILYLDAPDIIVEIDSEPIFSIETSTEAGTGHNAFQRFARLAASVENNVPAFYIYPEAAIVHRTTSNSRWDKINPLVFRALESVMDIYQIPALLYYFPSDFNTHEATPLSSPNLSSKGLQFETNLAYSACPKASHPEMGSMFGAINAVIDVFENHGIVSGRAKLLGKRVLQNRRNFMRTEYAAKGGNDSWSPLTATETVPTDYLLRYLERYETATYAIGELLRRREETVIYKVDAVFRGDPYPGALAAIDYLKCREGKTFEERACNLVIAWGSLEVDRVNRTLGLSSRKSTILDFVTAVKSSESKNILTKCYNELSSDEISRYYMQVRYGSTFSKVKHIRVFSYFADAILFPDGALWRDA